MNTLPLLVDQAVGDPSEASRLPFDPRLQALATPNRQVIVIDDEGSPSQKLDKGKGRAEGLSHFRHAGSRGDLTRRPAADPVDPSPIAGPAPPRQPIPDSFDLILGLARLNLQPVPEPRPAAAPFALPDTAVVPPPNALNPLEFNFGPAAAVFGAPPAGLPPPVVNPAPAPPIARRRQRNFASTSTSVTSRSLPSPPTPHLLLLVHQKIPPPWRIASTLAPSPSPPLLLPPASTVERVH